MLTTVRGLVLAVVVVLLVGCSDPCDSCGRAESAAEQLTSNATVLARRWDGQSAVWQAVVQDGESLTLRTATPVSDATPPNYGAGVFRQRYALSGGSAGCDLVVFEILDAEDREFWLNRADVGDDVSNELRAALDAGAEMVEVWVSCGDS